LKSEAKFTDNRHIYRFNQAYSIKQVIVNQDGFRGNKYAKEITLYINNSQGVDLADMKNNMALWKKVKG
jgi:allantoicase